MKDSAFGPLNVKESVDSMVSLLDYYFPIKMNAIYVVWKISLVDKVIFGSLKVNL